MVWSVQIFNLSNAKFSAPGKLDPASRWNKNGQVQKSLYKYPFYNQRPLPISAPIVKITLTSDWVDEWILISRLNQESERNIEQVL